MPKPERKLILDFSMAPGDVLMLSGAVRDLKVTYGDKYLIDVRTNFPAIWRHNPYITPLHSSSAGVERIVFGRKGYLPELRDAKKGLRMHFCTAFHRAIKRRTKIHIPILQPKPDLHLSTEEKQIAPIKGRYWIIVPGGKDDGTTKIWPQAEYQGVVDKLRPWGLQFVQEGTKKRHHMHPELNNVLNVVGKTGIRDLIRNIYHAEGVICGITFMMHVAGALEKPCVVLAGGREEPWWESYSNHWNAFGSDCEKIKVPHRFLHTLGQLPCCLKSGCWHRRVSPLNDGNLKYDKDLCTDPVLRPDGQTVPRCMTRINAAHAAEAVMWYYENGLLPPPQLRNNS